MFTASVALASLAATSLAPRPEGEVRLFVRANAPFDRYTRSPPPAEQAWMRQHYERMLVYSPYFDGRLAWYASAWVYLDAYALKRHWVEARRHREWIMRDVHGNALYIPFACSRGVCPQLAADVGNTAFRRFWIDKARTALEHGYQGLYIDDVNLTWRVSDGAGRHVRPVDEATDRPMTLQAWRSHFADFMAEIRRTFPETEIVHNSIWYAAPIGDPALARQIAAADFIHLERGGSDRGLGLGAGERSYAAYLRFIDHVHDLGRAVVVRDDGTTHDQRELGLASWLLTSRGEDLYGVSRFDWIHGQGSWPGFELDLGAAKGARELLQNGLAHRAFECGDVYVNMSVTASVHQRLPEPMLTIQAGWAQNVALGPRQASILRHRRCAMASDPGLP